MSFTPLLRRIREHKTNYRKRKALLIGKHTFAAVRISNENVLVQILRPEKRGDRVLTSAHSRELIRYGWKGSRKSIPACYLTGLLAGKKAAAKGAGQQQQQCILYTGMRRYSPRIAAAAKGLNDAGLKVPVEEETQPDEARTSGRHIADYASALKSDQKVYSSRFSGLVTEGFAPESYPARVEEVKSSVLSGTVVPPVRKSKEERKEKEKEKEEVAPTPAAAPAVVVAEPKKKEEPRKRTRKAKSDTKKTTKKKDSATKGKKRKSGSGGGDKKR